MSKVRKLSSMLGLLAVVSAGFVALKPGLIPESEVTAFLSREVVLYLVLGVMGLYGLFSLRESTVRPEELFLRFDRHPELVQEESDSLEMAFENHVNREKFRSAVEMVLIGEKGFSEEEAFEAISEGSWTNDKVAAAFVETDLSYPILERLREWLEDSGTMDRRISKTVEAIEEVYAEAS
ncbi:MAG: hypothetical protein ABEJ93_00125 [Candidatus Nanohalobium sp.]